MTYDNDYDRFDNCWSGHVVFERSQYLVFSNTIFIIELVFSNIIFYDILLFLSIIFIKILVFWNIIRIFAA